MPTNYPHLCFGGPFNVLLRSCSWRNLWRKHSKWTQYGRAQLVCERSSRGFSLVHATQLCSVWISETINFTESGYGFRKATLQGEDFVVLGSLNEVSYRLNLKDLEESLGRIF
jgi:hypothetical protein